MDKASVVLPSTISTLSLAIHPLPILNISEHLTRAKVLSLNPFVFGVILGVQSGREVEIVNSFELPVEITGDGQEPKVDHGFLASRREQYKQVFPSLDFIGWYSVAPIPTKFHISLQEQFIAYSSTPLLLLLQPDLTEAAQSLPLKVYEPTVEMRDRRSRNVFVEVPFSVETGEAERIAVDFTAKGESQGTSLTSHLTSQRAAVQMLHNRIQILHRYVKRVLENDIPKDHVTLRALASLVASVPASENADFRKEFTTEFADVQLTAYLAALTNSTSALNDLVDKHILHSSNNRGEERMIGGPRRRGIQGMRGHVDAMERLM